MSETMNVAMNKLVHWEMKKVAVERGMKVKDVYAEAIDNFLKVVRERNVNKEDV